MRKFASMQGEPSSFIEEDFDHVPIKMVGSFLNVQKRERHSCCVNNTLLFLVAAGQAEKRFDFEILSDRRSVQVHKV